jgi:chromosome segregation ATPase
MRAETRAEVMAAVNQMENANRRINMLKEQLAEALAVVRLTADQNLELAMEVKELKDVLRTTESVLAGERANFTALTVRLTKANREVVELADENERLKLKLAIRDRG